MCVCFSDLVTRVNAQSIRRTKKQPNYKTFSVRTEHSELRRSCDQKSAKQTKQGTQLTKPLVMIDVIYAQNVNKIRQKKKKQICR